MTAISFSWLSCSPTSPRGTLGSVTSLLAATLHQGNPDRNHKLWNIVSTERYILHMQVLLEFYTYEGFSRKTKRN
jgi:hypothetical protein